MGCQCWGHEKCAGLQPGISCGTISLYQLCPCSPRACGQRAGNGNRSLRLGSCFGRLCQNQGCCNTGSVRRCTEGTSSSGCPPFWDFGIIRLGKAGQCYILSGAYAEIQEMLKIAGILIGKHCPPLIPMPLARAAEPLLCYWAKTKERRPLYTRYSLDTLSSNVRFSSQRARSELGYSTRSMKATVRDTVTWLMEERSEKQNRK